MKRTIRIAAARIGFALLALSAGLLTAAPALAADARIAVAANFAAPAAALATAFEERTGLRVSVSSGSSGALYAQILQGAPFALFLSADATRPERLEAGGLAVPGSRFTYAIGKLVLWSPDPALVDAGGAVLRTGGFTHLAIANPETAPYGAAAMQVLVALDAADALEDRIVTGESIAQAFAFVKSGNAELGFVAQSQLSADSGGSRWQVPDALYAPIRQDAVLLDPDNEAARKFADFLSGTEAGEIIRQFGYGLATD